VANVHVSGHAAADELRQFHNIVRPSAFVPVHGEYRHLVAHARLAVETGTPPDQVFVCEDGDTVLLADGVTSQGESFEPGVVFVDALGVGDVGAAVLRARGQLSAEGICVAVVTVDQHSQPIGTPQVVQTGIIYEPDQADLLDQAAKALAEELQRTEDQGDLAVVRRDTVRALARFWRDATGRRPVILPVLMEI
jgi:ribonuclease J